MTSSAPQLRLFVESLDRSGSWNMAFDEFLLVQALNLNQLAVRIYGWETATVSLGYFQKDTSQVEHRLQALPIVRRLSGGGAILHHHEVTYSIAIPKSHPLANNPGQLYELVHAVIIKELSKCGVVAQCRGDVENASNDPFLCFTRQDPNDIVMHATKIVGSAQRRRRGAILQHGSILLRSSEHVPELAGIADLDPAARIEQLERNDLGRSIAMALGEDLPESSSGAKYQPVQLDNREEQSVIELQNKYKLTD